MFKIKIDRADTLWSKQVRARDGGRCRKPGCPKNEANGYAIQAHHIMPRVRSATRYYIPNGISLCVHHHVFGNDCVHKVGKQFVIDIIGLTEYKRLEKKSVVTTSRAKARNEFLATL